MDAALDEGTSQKNKHEALTLFLLYTAVILATLWWSGWVTNPSVYDRYLARLEGVSISVQDIERSRTFFQDVLNFAPAGTSKRALLLPDRRKIFLNQFAAPAPSELVLRVRNGFPRLYEILKKRIDALPDSEGKPALTPITEQTWGDEFILTDYDQNRFVYYRPKRRSVTRGD